MIQIQRPQYQVQTQKFRFFPFFYKKRGILPKIREKIKNSIPQQKHLNLMTSKFFK